MFDDIWHPVTVLFFSLTFNSSLTLTKPRDTRVKSCNCNVCVGRRLFYHAFNLLLKNETLDTPAWHHDGVREPRLRSGVWEVKAEHQQRDFQPFPLVLIYFSLRCFLSIAMHHLTLPKQAGAAQHQLKAIWLRSSTAARRIRLSLFRLLWNAFFFFSLPNIQNTQGSQIADMCARAWWNPAFFHALLCKTPMLFI